MERTSDTSTIKTKTETLISCPLGQTGIADMTQTSYSERHRLYLLLSCYSDEHEEKVDMMALAPITTIRVLGNSIAKHINKIVYRWVKHLLPPLKVYTIWDLYEACGNIYSSTPFHPTAVASSLLPN
jgi:hypothetical protein